MLTLTTHEAQSENLSKDSAYYSYVDVAMYQHHKECHHTSRQPSRSSQTAETSEDLVIDRASVPQYPNQDCITLC
jgi:hypothetical protein